jgi:hypothetical protein
MLVRSMTVLAFVVLLMQGSWLCAKQSGPDLNAGDVLLLDLRGNLAREYARRSSSPHSANQGGLQISTSATVVQKLNDGRLRIEHSTPVWRGNKADRLLTLTATIDPKDLRADVTPTNTPTYASPAEHKKGAKPALTTKKTTSFCLPLSELKKVKLRTWTLTEEVGDGDSN